MQPNKMFIGRQFDKAFLACMGLGSICLVLALSIDMDDSSGLFLERISSKTFVPATPNHIVARQPLNWQLGKAAIRRNPLQLNLDEIRYWIQLGKNAQNSGYLGLAETLIAKKRLTQHNELEINLALADIRQYQHRFQQALELLNYNISRSPSHLASRLLRAQLFTIQARFDEARKDCRKLLRLDYVPYTLCIAQIKSRTGQLLQAYNLLSRMSQNASLPQSYQSLNHALLAEMALRLHRNRAASDWYLRQINSDRDSPHAMLGLAQWLVDSKQCDRAILWLRKIKDTWQKLILSHRCGNQTAQAKLAFIVSTRMQRKEPQDNALLATKYLYVDGSASKALKYARNNWLTQKEPEDLRLLALCAVKANDAQAIKQIKQWQQLHSYQDLRLDFILQPEK